MRYAIFSDIHSNLEAITAFKSIIQRDKFDRLICVGDIVGYGANPNECIELTRQITRFIVCGNHDRAAVGLFDTTYFNYLARISAIWTSKILNEEGRAYLKTLNLIYKEANFTVVHGSLNRPELFEYILDGDVAQKTFKLMKTQLCFVGHSHIPGVFYETETKKLGYTPGPKIIIREDTRYIVNVGSIGQPRDYNPQGAYCVYDVDSNIIEIRRFEYDIKTAYDKIIKANLPHFLAERLIEGR